MPEYRVLAHRRVLKFLKQLEDENLKTGLKKRFLDLKTTRLF